MQQSELDKEQAPQLRFVTNKRGMRKYGLGLLQGEHSLDFIIGHTHTHIHAHAHTDMYQKH